MSGLGHGLRFALGTLTVLPVRVTRWDRPAARAGMLCAPVAGALVGVAAGACGAAVLAADGGPLLAAVGTVAVPAALTRGLHLDGLADTADGLGSGRPADAALRVMKASDIGPFGVLALVLTVLAQVAAVAELFDRDWRTGAAGALLAAVTARVALTLTCRGGVPAARPDGLGAAVAGSVPGALAAVVCAAAAGGAAALGGCGVVPAGGPAAAARWAAAVLAGLVAGEALLRHCRRRLGGVTGDVLGAVAETASLTTLLSLVLF